MAAQGADESSLVSVRDLTATRGASEVKEFELLQFASGSRVLLVSDVVAASKPGGSEQIEAAVAVSISCGSFCDSLTRYSGNRLEGRAHLTEHLLFMGSEPFPEENEYERYLSEHGGDCNAYTDAEATCFYLTVRPSALAGALDRLIAAISKPLLRNDTVEREVMAVESEFQQAKLSDPIRAEQIMVQAIFRKDHEAAVFLWGNHKSLVADPLEHGFSARDDVEAFFRSEYRADRMHGVVRAPLPLAELRALALKAFAPVAEVASVGGVVAETVPSADTSPPSPAATTPGATAAAAAAAAAAAVVWSPVWRGSPVRDGVLPCVCRWRPVNDRLALSLVWVLPPLSGWWRGSPDEYVSHCLGHEGKGSLLSLLRARSLAASLSAGVNDGGLDSNSRFCCFDVTITLTAHGAERWQEVVEAVFSYLSMLRAAGPQKRVWQELQAVARLAYDNAHDESPEEHAQRLAATMARTSLSGRAGAAAAWLEAAEPALLGDPEVAVADLGHDGPVPDAELLTADQVPTLEFASVAPRVRVLLAALSPRAVYVSIACSQFPVGADAAAVLAGLAKAEAARGETGTAPGRGVADGGSASRVAATRRAIKARHEDQGEGVDGDDEGDSDHDDDDDEEEADDDDDENGDDGDDDEEDDAESEEVEHAITAGGAEAISPAALASLGAEELDSAEPWFGTPYRAGKLPTGALAAWSSPAPVSALRLPAPNAYLPASLPVHPPCPEAEWAAAASLVPLDASVVPSAAPASALSEGVHAAALESRRLPSLLEEGPAGRLWWQQDTTHRLPRSTVRALLYLRPLRARKAQDDATLLACAHMWALLAYDLAQEEAYEASMAELHVDLQLRYSSRALCLQVEGFSPCLPRLLAAILDALRAVAEAEVSEELEAAFDRLREVSRRRVAASGIKPIDHAQGERLRLLLGRSRTTRETQLDGLESVELSEVLAFASSVVGSEGGQVFAEVLVAGNETAASARAIFETVQAAAIVGAGASSAVGDGPAGGVLSAERLLDGGGKMPRQSVLQLPGGVEAPLVCRVPPRHPGESNAAAVLYFQAAAPRGACTVAKLHLLEALIEEPLFDRLRTQEQLGYAVHCQLKCTLGVAGFAISLQGSRFPCEHLSSRALEFVAWWVATYLPSLEAERFESTRAALVSTMLQPPATAEDAANTAWDSLESAQFDFGLDIAAAHIVRELTLADLAAFANELMVDAATRRLLVVEVGSTVPVAGLWRGFGESAVPEAIADDWYVPELAVMMSAAAAVK